MLYLLGWTEHVHAINALSKKQTVVSHSSTESEIVALDTALRVEGLPVLGFWDIVVDILADTRSPGGPNGPLNPTEGSRDAKASPAPISTFAASNHGPSKAMTFEDMVLSTRPLRGDDLLASGNARDEFVTPLVIAEDNGAVIKILQKGRTSALRHVLRSHRISIHWLVECLRREGVRIRYVNTKLQIADLLTKHFARVETYLPLLAQAFLFHPGDAELRPEKVSVDPPPKRTATCAITCSRAAVSAPEPLSEPDPHSASLPPEPFAQPQMPNLRPQKQFPSEFKNFGTANPNYAEASPVR